jgi:hypothetical protein
VACGRNGLPSPAGHANGTGTRRRRSDASAAGLPAEPLGSVSFIDAMPDDFTSHRGIDSDQSAIAWQGQNFVWPS